MLKYLIENPADRRGFGLQYSQILIERNHRKNDGAVIIRLGSRFVGGYAGCLRSGSGILSCRSLPAVVGGRGLLRRLLLRRFLCLGLGRSRCLLCILIFDDYGNLLVLVLLCFLAFRGIVFGGLNLRFVCNLRCILILEYNISGLIDFFFICCSFRLPKPDIKAILHVQGR